MDGWMDGIDGKNHYRGLKQLNMPPKTVTTETNIDPNSIYCLGVLK